MSERSCDYCGTSLEGRRRQARYCNSTCRAEACKRRKAGLSPTRSSNGKKPLQTVGTKPRRPSKDGRGTRIYFTPEEIRAVRFPFSASLRHLDSAMEKLKRAEGRCMT